jgi:hypothetical protein
MPPRVYKDVLAGLSQRTKTPVTSLVASFTILHEVTAILPLVAFFYAGRWSGLGASVVGPFARRKSVLDGQHISDEPWMTRKCREWVNDGEMWAGRVGRKYGIFGFEEGQAATPNLHVTDAGRDSYAIADDVANAIFAYAATKVRHLCCYLQAWTNLGLTEGYSSSESSDMPVPLTCIFKRGHRSF